jgi:hypothetical protein
MPVAPQDPAEAQEADVADPGKVEEIKAGQSESKSGKYGATSLKPFKPGEDKEKPNGWIAIRMLDEAGKPVAGLAYRIVLPHGGMVAEGTLDEKGVARVEGFEPGSCKVSFPSLDCEAWLKK